MRRPLLFILALSGCAFLFSCKSKQIMVDRPPAKEPVGTADDQLKDLQDDLPGTKVERVDEGLKVTFDSNILFELNSSYLTGRAHDQLRNFVKVLEDQAYDSITIAGHTDNTGTGEYNKWLSERRAESVKAYLQSLGIAAERMNTAGYGESSPIASNDDPAGQARNRRVEITIGQ